MYPLSQCVYLKIKNEGPNILGILNSRTLGEGPTGVIYFMGLKYFKYANERLGVRLECSSTLPIPKNMYYI